MALLEKIAELEQEQGGGVEAGDLAPPALPSIEGAEASPAPAAPSLEGGEQLGDGESDGEEAALEAPDNEVLGAGLSGRSQRALLDYLLGP